MRFILTALILSWLAAPAAALPRVLSLNLCADPYLMAFAAPQQIIALTALSRDASLSAHAAAAQNFPVTDGQIENIIDLKPDLVIVSSWSDPIRNALIERLGFHLLTLDAAQNYDAARQEILALGEAIQRPAQARAYLAGLDAQMAALRPLANAPKILPLQRRNLTVGEGHILDDILTRAGAVNMGRDRRNGGGDNMRRISLETALAAEADYILLNNRAQKPDSRGMEFITHPALARAYGLAQRLHINGNLLSCAGASTPRALAALLGQFTEGQLTEGQLTEGQKRAAPSQ
jgi:iron complex transport system substrate-binding protein